MIAIAWAALFSWPIVGMVLYRNLQLPVALIVTVLGGQLLLPSSLGLDLPLLPVLDKSTIPVIVAFVLTIAAIQQAPQAIQIAPGWIPRSLEVRILILLMLAGAVATILTNMDPLFTGAGTLPGLTMRDAISAVFRAMLFVLIPFLLGRKILSSPEAQRTLLKAIAISALVYSIPALWEVRMSPQLHIQIYGYFPHSFLQQMRAGGFRPVVFLGHGLAVAAFFVSGIIAATILMRDAKGNERLLWMLSAIWLFGVLILCKSLGPLMIALVILPIALFLNMRMQLLAALCIAGTVLTYPLLRSADLVPVDRVLEFATSIDPARAQSFAVRIVNEDQLLEKVMERPVFGWGGWGRARVYNERGHDISLTDGAWVTEMGYSGWVGYIALFGLLCWPIIRLYFKGHKAVDTVCMGLILIICARLLHLIPNSGIGSITWLCVGALVGRLEMNVWKPQKIRPSASYARSVPEASGYARRFPSSREEETRPAPADIKENPRRSNAYRRLNKLGGHRK